MAEDADLRAKIAYLEQELRGSWPAEIAGIVACVVFLFGLLVGSMLQ